MRDRPPAVAAAVLRLLLPDIDRDAVLGELHELYLLRRGRRGVPAARWWYRRQLVGYALQFARHGRRRPRRLRQTGPASHRGRRGVEFLSLFGEVRQALRRLVRVPVFTVVSVLTIGVGIGAFTSIFGLVESVLLEPMPYENPSQLVWVWRNYSWMGFPRGWLGGVDIIAMREQRQVFEQVAAVRSGRMNLTGVDRSEPREISVIIGSHELFDLLGVPPIHGRGFLSADDGPGAGPVAVLGHDLWRSNYGADPGVVGETIYLNGEAVTVVGVAAENFHFVQHRSLAEPVGGDLYLNLRLDLSQTSPLGGSYGGLARVRVGTHPDQIEAALAAVAQPADDAFDNKGLRLWAAELKSELTENVRPALLALVGSAAFLLLILSANLATLMIGRGSVRARELAIRSALGGSRGRITWSVLSESLIVGGLGGAIGVGLASLGTNLIVSAAPADLPRLAEVGIDASILAVAVAITLGMALAAGMAPAFQIFKVDVMMALKEGGHRTGASLRGGRVRGALVATQVALSLMLLVGAGLVAQAFAHLLREDPGFDPGTTLTFRVPLPSTTYPDGDAVKRFHMDLRERFERLPGVTHAGAVSSLPLAHTTNQTGVTFPGARGYTENDESNSLLIDWFRATPGYFAAAGYRVLAGRSFDATDGETAFTVMIDDVLARRFFPDGSPLDQQLIFGGDTANPARIVGVVDQARIYNVHADDRGQVYIPFAGAPTLRMSYALRASVDPNTLVAAARNVLREMDPAVPMSEIQTLDAIVKDSLGKQELSLTLLGGFALGALLLATLGIYGVVANNVAQRTQELGVRMALGADAGRVLRMVVAHGLRLAGIGAGLGIVGAAATSRLLQGVVVGVDTGNPAVYVLVVGALVAVAAAASYVPARRATRIDPMVALRPE